MDKWSWGQNGGNQCHRKEYRKKNEKNEDSLLLDLWDIKCTNIRIIGVPEGKETEIVPEKISEES